MRTTDQTIDWETELPLHREWMVRLAQSRLSDAHAAEDVIQDVVLSIVRNNPQLDDPSKTQSWLYQAVIYRIADQLRSRYRQQNMVETLTSSEESKRQDMNWEWMLAEEQHELLRAAMNRLPATDQEIVLLKFAHSWSYRQIGSRFDLAERAVEYRLVKAKQFLRDEMLKLNGAEYE